MKDDLFIHQPANPGANATVTWLDTADGTYRDYAGFTGDLLFDEDVTLVIKTAAEGVAVPDIMNGEGLPPAGELLLANTKYDLRVAFLGWRTVIEVVTGSTPPSGLWHMNGRVSKAEVG